MGLSWGQWRCYQDRFHVYRRTQGAADPTTGEVPDGVWAKVGDSVRGVFVPTLNDNDPSGVGRIKRDTMLTEDGAQFPRGSDVRAGDMLRLVTPGLAGGEGFGQLWRTKAAPRPIIRLADCLQYQLMQDEQANALMPDANSYS